MKKLLALLLAVLMIMGLVACGSKEAPAEEAPTEDAAVEEAPDFCCAVYSSMSRADWIFAVVGRPERSST